MPGKKHRVAKRVLLGVACLLVAAGIAFGVYVSIHYAADETALAALQGPDVVETKDYIVCGNPNARLGFVFYPGAKVDAAAYLPYLAEVAAGGDVLCAVVKPVFRLAIFAPNAADALLRDYPGVTRWAVGGHSLGGVVAAGYAQGHTARVAGLVLLASYPSGDISALPLPVLSLTATRDEVLNQNSYEAACAKLPPSTQYFAIEGGNHSQFGSYGFQRGDGEATIPPAAQRAIAAEQTRAFLLALAGGQAAAPLAA